MKINFIITHYYSAPGQVEYMECHKLTHTPKDNLSVVNYERVAECALGIAALIKKLKTEI